MMNIQQPNKISEETLLLFKKVLEDVIEYYKSLFEKIAKSIAKELK
jgi:hypothetical protein